MATKKSSTRDRQTRKAFQSMKRIMLGFRARMDVQLRPKGVTMAQLQLLFAVRNRPGSSGAQLARTCFITPQTTQALLKHLEESGLIVRGKDPVNDRIVTASLTAAGERLAQAVEKESVPIQRDLWKGFTASELDGLNDLLARCLANLGESDDPFCPPR